MCPIARTLYTLVHWAAMPAFLLHLVTKGLRDNRYWQRWNERLGGSSGKAKTKPLFWIHAVSVGEVQAAIPLVEALMQRWPGYDFLVTTMTPTGAMHVAKTLAGVRHQYLPYDLPPWIARFLEREQPLIALIIETELWPNLFAACRQRCIPTVLINARLSPHSAANYHRFRSLFSPLFAGINAVAAQSNADAERIIALGADRYRTFNTGNLKFDIKPALDLPERARAIRRQFGTDRHVWIAASTHKGEEQQVLKAFAIVREQITDCLLMIVPRHPERSAAVERLAIQARYHTDRRSRRHVDCLDLDVYIADTIGELPLLYAASDVAFVGGSLVNHGGHNMLEPTALGIPVITGPHVHNFELITDQLIDAGAAVQVPDAGALGKQVIEYLLDYDLRHRAGEKGRVFVTKNQGVLLKVMGIIDRVLASSYKRAP